ncbi:MAG TPA: tetratricopeptide repeat protein, partial [Alphaproteobacteria bacterium]|nr:tetratricopeptide repeat protein [Alphaproteobacteria bacterium]
MRGLFAVIAILFLGLTAIARADQPDDAVSEFYKGHAALQQNDAQEAIEHFSKALQIGKLDQTQVAYVHHYRAIAYQRLDRQQEAIDDYTQALAIGSLPQRVQAAIYYN